MATPQPQKARPRAGLLPVVAHIFPWDLGVGGAQRMLYDWCRCEGEQWRVHVFTDSQLPSIWPMDNAEVHHHPTYSSIAAAVAALRPDLVVLHDPGPDSALFVPLGVPAVWIVHAEGVFASRPDATWGKPAVVLSDYAPEPPAPGWERFRVTPLPLGVVLDEYRSLGVRETASPVAGIVGRLAPEKLPMSFLAALEHWQPGPWRLRVIGGGDPDGYGGQALARLRRLPFVEIAGETPPWHMPEVYAGLDALIIPSTTETGSFALVEAMASGLPVVARSVGGIPYQSGGVAILRDSDEDILDSVRSLDSSRMRLGFATRARRQAERRHDLYAHCAEHSAAFRAAMAAAVPGLADTVSETAGAADVLPVQVSQDTALILAYTYEDERRHQATLTAVRQLASLDPMPALRVVVLDDGFRHAELRDVVEAAGGRIMHLPLRPEHAYVFHKEDLYNYAVRHLPTEFRHLIFLDADTYPDRLDWVALTRRKLIACGDGTVLQPWGEFRDTTDHNLAGWSMCRRIRQDADQWKTHANPGLCIAMTRGCFDSIGGFPTSCPAGAGDTMLMLEISGGKYHISYMNEFPYFAEGFRQVPAKAVDWLPVTMTHVHHGAVKTRGYHTRHEILQAFWPFGESLYKDANGILCVQQGSGLQYCLERRRSCQTSADVAKLLAEARVFYPLIRTLESYIEARTADPQYVGHRWAYLQAAGNMLRDVARFGRVLEIGPRNLPLVHNATFMDIDPQWQPGAVIHDAGLEPWPFADREFTTVVALQMCEHLEGRQQTFFAEAFRVARWVIVSLPWRWTVGEPGHIGLDWPQVNAWTGGMQPRRQFLDTTDPTHRRMVLCYCGEDRP